MLLAFLLSLLLPILVGFFCALCGIGRWWLILYRPPLPAQQWAFSCDAGRRCRRPVGRLMCASISRQEMKINVLRSIVNRSWYRYIGVFWVEDVVESCECRKLIEDLLKFSSYLSSSVVLLVLLGVKFLLLK